MKPLLFPRTLAALLLVLLPLPSFALPRERDSWLRVESAHFVFFSSASERSSRRIAISPGTLLAMTRYAPATANPVLDIKAA